jgi:L-ascorbate metabolism protein UlaG (beta-lactamase superfamily)
MSAELTVTRVAHACVLLDFGGPRLLTDPWFSERAGFPGYYRGEPLGVELRDLPALDGVASSHGHYDHYDVGAFKAYPNRDVPFAVKRGTEAKAERVGFTDVRALDAWETTRLGPITVTAVPAKHFVPQVTYVFEANGYTVYFGGDTLVVPELRAVAQRFPPLDLALLPVDGLMLRPMLDKRGVMNPEEAAELTAILRPRYGVPTHYAFHGGWLGDRLVLKYDGSPERYHAAAKEAAPATRVEILSPGQPLGIPRA